MAAIIVNGVGQSITGGTIEPFTSSEKCHVRNLALSWDAGLRAVVYTRATGGDNVMILWEKRRIAVGSFRMWSVLASRERGTGASEGSISE